MAEEEDSMGFGEEVSAKAKSLGEAAIPSILPPKPTSWVRKALNGITAAPAMCFIMLLAGRRTVMGKLSLPAYLKILGWAATAIMAIAAVGMFLTSGQ